MLSSEIQKRLDNAKKEQDNYTPNDEVLQRISGLRLIMIVGPAAVGKTRIIQATADLDNDFGQVSVFTTRAKRPDDDPRLFRYFEHSDEGVGELLSRIEQKQVVNYAIHPTGDMYGTMPEDYPGKYNLLPTLSGAVSQLQSLPFESKTVIGLTTNPDTWAKWFNQRQTLDRSTREKRLFEAVMSLDWLLSSGTPGITFVSNVPGKPEEAARAIIAAAKNELLPSDAEKAHEQAIAMRQRALELLEKGTF